MRILWFTPTPSLSEELLNKSPMGGAWIKSLEALIQERVDLSIAFYHDKEMPSFKYGKTTYYPIKSGNDNFFFKLKRRFLHKIEPKSDVNKFLKIVETVNPDLIHIHGTERPFGLVQKFTSIPTVISIQGNLSVYQLKFFSGISFLNVLRHSGIRNWVFFDTYFNEYLRFTKQARREVEIFKLTKNVIGRTHWDERVSKILSPNVNYFHNDEVLREGFYEKAWENRLDGPLHLFTINGANIYKGIETLIHCAYLLDLNEVNYIWSIAGLDENDDIVKVARKSIKKKISNNIIFLGRLGADQIKENILNSNIYISVSHIENSPNSLCEALLVGAPCIATYAGGTSNFIEDGHDGILIQDGDPYAMAGAIAELKENYYLAKRYGANARNRALHRHDKNVILDDLLKIYETVVRQ